MTPGPGFRRDFVRDAPSGAEITPKGSFPQPSRTKIPLRRRNLAEAAVLAEKPAHTSYRYCCGAYSGASSLGASEE